MKDFSFNNKTFYEKIEWHKFPSDPPASLKWGQYKTCIVKTKSGNTLACSWLFSGWHERHDGCSDMTNYVIAWCEMPKGPKLKEEKEIGNTQID